MISEKEREEIRIEAKRILDNFASELNKISLKPKEIAKPQGGFRKESQTAKPDEEFRKALFDNAPEHNENCLIAEKKKW